MARTEFNGKLALDFLDQLRRGQPRLGLFAGVQPFFYFIAGLLVMPIPAIQQHLPVTPTRLIFLTQAHQLLRRDRQT